MKKIETVNQKQLTKSINIYREVNMIPLEENGTMEITPQLLELGVIDRCESLDIDVPKDWTLKEEDFLSFVDQISDWGIRVSDVDLDFDTIRCGNYEEGEEIDDVEECIYDIYDHFWNYLVKKGSNDEKTKMLIENSKK